MKVLFISSGNNINLKIAPFIKTQGDSLIAKGIDVTYYLISGKGFFGYIKAGLKLRKLFKKNRYDIIHAHYVLSGWVALIGSFTKPLVLSLMGSDTYGEYIKQNKVKIKSRINTLLTLLIQPFTSAIIVKSLNIMRFIYLKKKAYLIPNGVNLSFFKNLNQIIHADLDLDPLKKYILFLGRKEEPRKNYFLAEKAVSSLENPDVILISPYPVEHSSIPKYLNIIDVLISTSLMEGSPNVIKEAMACNCPIVTTDVGDVRWVLGKTEGCYISSFEPEDVAEKIKAALASGKKTNGRNRILELGLDSETVALKIIDIYKDIIKV